MLLCTLQGLLVADAEANHAGIVELHLLDGFKIGQFGCTELVLCACDACGAHHVDESVGVGINLAHPVFFRFGRNHHDNAHIVAVGYGLHLLHVVFEGEVGDNGPAHTCLLAVLAKAFYPIMHHHIQVAHQYQRDVHLFLDGRQLAEQQTQCHAVLQRHGTGLLYHGTIGQRVTEGDAHLNHVYASPLQGENHLARLLQGGAACTKVERQQLPVASLGEKCIDSVHCSVIHIVSLYIYINV